MPAGRAGDARGDPVVEAYKRDVDRTLLVESLKLTAEQRIDRLEEFTREVETLRTGKRA